MLPLWHFGGFALGALTALMSEQSAMACTEAVEDTVVAHYDRQLRRLPRGEADLSVVIERIRDEEREHGEDAVAGGARRAPAYKLLYSLISAGCRAAIRVSEKI
jgi:ubiquinone biosynthesis monooxygenase Coq7